jgi:hypothetical protein
VLAGLASTNGCGATPDRACSVRNCSSPSGRASFGSLNTEDDRNLRLAARPNPQGEPFVAGVYPLLLDETCFFLAVDFDKAGWRDDAAAFLEACRFGIPSDRSGRGPTHFRAYESDFLSSRW